MDVETGEDKVIGPTKGGIEDLLRASSIAGPEQLEELE